MKKVFTLNIILTSVLFITVCFSPLQKIRAQSNYQPDMLIGYSTTVDYSGGGVYNSDGSGQILYKILKNYGGVEFRLSVRNAGRLVDRLIVTGSVTDDYWTVQYFDSVGRDITSQVTGNGWQTASLPAGRSENLTIKIIPRKTLIYGQENAFYVKARSGYDSSKQDVVKAVLTIRFNDQSREGNEGQGNNQGQGQGQGSGSSGSTSGRGTGNNQGGNVNSRPDIEIKATDDKVYLGKNLYENPDAIAIQIETITTNEAFNPNVLYFKVTNAGSQGDNFIVKSGKGISDWQINFFALRGKNWNSINEQINNGQSVKLGSQKEQEYKIEVNVPENTTNQSFVEIAVIAYSANDINKIDATKFRINVDTDLDKDGMADSWEKKYGLNPRDSDDANLDPDGDFLINKDEFTNGTDPHNKDTDADGLWDGAYLDSVKMILPGLQTGHLVVAGPIKSARGDALPDQTIHFLLNDSLDSKNEFTYPGDAKGMMVFQIGADLLTKPGGYILQATGNGKILQSADFFLAPYGNVYEKKNKKPMPGVKVNLEKCYQSCCQYLTSTVTDDSGAYGGFMIPAGSYKLRVEEQGFEPYKSKIFNLTKEGNKYDILLRHKTPPWLAILYWILGILFILAILIMIPRVKNYYFRQEYQPDGQIKLAHEENYLGDTIYNADGLGQTKKQEIKLKDRAIFHIRIQNDGTSSDQFLVKSFPAAKGWALKFCNVLDGGNEITNQVVGLGWKTGNLASGITKDIRLEVWVDDKNTIENNIYGLPITINSVSDPEKRDVIKAKVILIEEKIAKIEKIEPTESAEKNIVLPNDHQNTHNVHNTHDTHNTHNAHNTHNTNV